MSTRDLKGLYSALLVAFDENGNINEKVYVRLYVIILMYAKWTVYMLVVAQVKTSCFPQKRKTYF